MRRALLCLAALGVASPASAGWYASPSVRWGAFAMRPVADEATPNYYGYGGALSGGYSVRQVLDFGLFGSFLPGTRETATFMAGDAFLAVYGAELAVRMSETLYVGLRGGPSRHALTKARRDGEVEGAWTGTAGGLALAGIIPFGRENFLQTGVELMHTVLTPEGDEERGKRRLDAFAVTFGYTFNDHKSYRIDNSILGDFVRSINFF